MSDERRRRKPDAPKNPKGDVHFRWGGRSSFMIRTYATESSARGRAAGWLTELADLERASGGGLTLPNGELSSQFYDEEAYNRILSFVPDVRSKPLPVDIEFVNGSGMTIVARLWREQIPDLGPLKGTVYNYEPGDA